MGPTMFASDDLLDRAQRMEPAAMHGLLAGAYPAVGRIACALVGREDLARRVAARVLARSLRVLPSWRRGAAPENWYYHHTLIAAREAAGAAGPDVDPLADALVARSPDAVNAGYVAFVRALRRLPPQQAEAFLLHHGERLNQRYLALAMDCSTAAAEAHLRAAGESLDALVAGGVGAHVTALTQAYAALTPAAGSFDAALRGIVGGYLRPIRRRRLLRRLVLIMIVGLCAVALWHWRDAIGSIVGRASIPHPTPTRDARTRATSIAP